MLAYALEALANQLVCVSPRSTVVNSLFKILKMALSMKEKRSTKETEISFKMNNKKMEKNKFDKTRGKAHRSKSAVRKFSS